jgi:hypothetical protein
MDPMEQQVADLTEAFAAQDTILREILAMMIQLGRFSRAWDEDESNAALSVLISRLRELADTREKKTARSLVLREFAKHAEQFLPRNNQDEPTTPRSGEEPQ